MILKRLHADVVVHLSDVDFSVKSESVSLPLVTKEK